VTVGIVTSWCQVAHGSKSRSLPGYCIASVSCLPKRQLLHDYHLGSIKIMYFTEAALLRCLVDAASTLIKTLILLDIIFSCFASIIVTYFERFGLPHASLIH
jgi:hypothetical protein